MVGRDDVAAAFRHLLAVRIKNPSADDDVVPRHGLLMQIGLNDCIERPGANDLVALRTDIHGKQFAVSLGIVGPMTRNLRSQRARGPGIHDIGIADEAVRLASHCLVEAGRRLGERIHRKLTQVRYDGLIVARLPALVQWIPDWKWHAEIALPADAPILIESFDPVFIARSHERRMPLDTRTLLEQSFFLVQ